MSSARVAYALGMDHTLVERLVGSTPPEALAEFLESLAAGHPTRFYSR